MGSERAVSVVYEEHQYLGMFFLSAFCFFCRDGLVLFLGNSHSLLFLYSVWNHFHKFSKIERDAMMDGSNSDQQLSIDCR